MVFSLEEWGWEFLLQRSAGESQLNTSRRAGLVPVLRTGTHEGCLCQERNYTAGFFTHAPLMKSSLKESTAKAF